LDGGHFGDALDAPGAPEIEEDDLAFGGGEVEGLAVEGAVDEVRGGLGVVDEVGRLLVGGDLVYDEFEEDEADDNDEEGVRRVRATLRRIVGTARLLWLGSMYIRG
jgi:hypothetical protein